MNDETFKNAIENIINGYYDESDIKVIKEKQQILEQEESKIKRLMEKNKNSFVRTKDKNEKELKHINKSIKEIQKILKQNGIY